jgi:uncharacterized membrane protein
VFSASVAANRLLLPGIVAELALLFVVVYTPMGNALLATAPLGVSVWLFIVPFALLMLVLEEGRKSWLRRREGLSGVGRP